MVVVYGQHTRDVRFTLSFYGHCAKMQRVSQNIAFLSTRSMSEVVSTIFFIIHDIFHLDARAMERIRGCVTIFILVAVYYLRPPTNSFPASSSSCFPTFLTLFGRC